MMLRELCYCVSHIPGFLYYFVYYFPNDLILCSVELELCLA